MFGVGRRRSRVEKGEKGGEGGRRVEKGGEGGRRGGGVQGRGHPESKGRVRSMPVVESLETNSDYSSRQQATQYPPAYTPPPLHLTHANRQRQRKQTKADRQTDRQTQTQTQTTSYSNKQTNNQAL